MPVAGAEVTLPVDLGDGADELEVGDESKGAGKDCPCIEDVVADDLPLIEEEADVPGVTIEVAELLENEGLAKAEELGRVGDTTVD